jgi:alkanesulfonate monooxygenase SsuD/methylene tetrahydromethanopterin reductase-like flavin-dependent oxidoreductase (luciferase family)
LSIKFSIDLTGNLPVHDYPRLARQVETYGFDEVHVVDDLMFKPAWPLLALMGQQTERIKLGPALIAPRIVHPAYHAANLAVLDELTGGPRDLRARTGRLFRDARPRSAGEAPDDAAGGRAAHAPPARCRPDATQWRPV